MLQLIKDRTVRLIRGSQGSPQYPLPQDGEQVSAYIERFTQFSKNSTLLRETPLLPVLDCYELYRLEPFRTYRKDLLKMILLSDPDHLAGINQILDRVSEFCQLGAGSVEHHHSEPGGLLAHHLETAIFFLQANPDKTNLIPSDIRVPGLNPTQLTTTARLVGSVLCLTHDLGKIVAANQFFIQDPLSNQDEYLYNPLRHGYTETPYLAACSHFHGDFDRVFYRLYLVTWEDSMHLSIPDHDDHALIAASQLARRYLSLPDELDIINPSALSAGTVDPTPYKDKMEPAVKAADRASTEAYFKVENSKLRVHRKKKQKLLRIAQVASHDHFSRFTTHHGCWVIDAETLSKFYMKATQRYSRLGREKTLDEILNVLRNWKEHHGFHDHPFEVVHQQQLHLHDGKLCLIANRTMSEFMSGYHNENRLASLQQKVDSFDASQNQVLEEPEIIVEPTGLSSQVETSSEPDHPEPSSNFSDVQRELAVSADPPEPSTDSSIHATESPSVQNVGYDDTDLQLLESIVAFLNHEVIPHLPTHPKGISKKDGCYIIGSPLLSYLRQDIERFMPSELFAEQAKTTFATLLSVRYQQGIQQITFTRSFSSLIDQASGDLALSDVLNSSQSPSPEEEPDDIPSILSDAEKRRLRTKKNYDSFKQFVHLTYDANAPVEVTSPDLLFVPIQYLDQFLEGKLRRQSFSLSLLDSDMENKISTKGIQITLPVSEFAQWQQLAQNNP